MRMGVPFTVCTGTWSTLGLGVQSIASHPKERKRRKQGRVKGKASSRCLATQRGQRISTSRLG